MKQKQFLNGTLNLSLVVPKIENCKHKFFIVNLQNTICFCEKGILWSKDCHTLRRENLHNNNNLLQYDVVNSSVEKPNKMSSAVLENGVPDALIGTLRQQQQQLPQAPHHYSDDTLSPGPDPEG